MAWEEERGGRGRGRPRWRPPAGSRSCPATRPGFTQLSRDEAAAQRLVGDGSPPRAGTRGLCGRTRLTSRAWTSISSLDEHLERHLGRSAERGGLAAAAQTGTRSSRGESSRLGAEELQTPLRQCREDWEIDPAKLVIKGVIARGTFGTVHRGVYDGQDVAVKLLDWGEDGHRSEQEIFALRVAFAQEVAVWHKLDHPNVTKRRTRRWRCGSPSMEPRGQQPAAAARAEAAAAHGAVEVRQRVDGAVGPAARGGREGRGDSGTRGGLEVQRRRHALDATVFEFGSAAESGAVVTLAGYCPVSDELEPCRWELVPATGEGAPQFRIVF
ncbi:uncharacterized protein LOC133904613 [Phragmites australis]|uniref:uncharacterized protein LOC133904613 n=1 Tax=Phragmites australis TaxID=29695 RepID=UPI002D789EDA|nr:uncharacterized protein LOC133904613 [Phragmites australis]